METSQNSKLPPVELEVTKLSPKVVKYDSEAFTVATVTAEAKKKLFENSTNSSSLVLEICPRALSSKGQGASDVSRTLCILRCQPTKVWSLDTVSF